MVHGFIFIHSDSWCGDAQSPGAMAHRDERFTPIDVTSFASSMQDIAKHQVTTANFACASSAAPAQSPLRQSSGVSGGHPVYERSTYRLVDNQDFGWQQ